MYFVSRTESQHTHTEEEKLRIVASWIAVFWIWIECTNGQVFSSLFHDYYISQHGCNIPFYGGLKISKDNNNPLCINTSLYNVDMVRNVFSTIFEKMKIPCKLSETYYGVPIIEETEGNATM